MKKELVVSLEWPELSWKVLKWNQVNILILYVSLIFEEEDQMLFQMRS